jgi:endonuclease-3
MATHGRRHTTAPPAARPRKESRKLPFDIEAMFARIEKAIEPYKKAAMFELAEQGFSSLFEQLIACIISIRTFDEVSAPAARKLFEVARTPVEVARLSVKQIDELIHSATFHEPKSKTIHDIAGLVMRQYGGELPCDLQTLLSFRGVGPKCAHLAMGIACDQPYISVDVHVERVTNRWGYVAASSAQKTLKQLEEKLPKEQWIDINRLLVPFGKHICTGRLPKCSTCPVLQYCRQVGVEKHR